MNNILNQLSVIGIIPVVKIEDVNKAVPVAKALCDGGLNCAEITFRTANADKAIKSITSAMPNMLIGAGTVLTTEQVDKAIEAGAKFIVSPGFNPEVVRYCIERNVLIIPGCSSPSDIEQAIKLNLEVVKFFPAEALGGIKTIKAIAAPYVGLKFVPTGGINEKNMNEYLSSPRVLACGGSWMVNDALIKSGEFGKITELTQQAVKTMLGFELGHIGINSENTDEASQIAGAFSLMFGMDYREGNDSIYAGNSIEVMKKQALGRNGHIAISTNSMERAIAYMQSRGYELDLDNSKKDDDGNPVAVYFKQEIGGFAVHLTLKV
ncbi:MAG: bifunctional 4-hydroxy-2-oxoglutarate aldolase/2-dehydro-3-deoxy-phosphogluconate aldolase [Tepidanaerobacteraceae bacterium]|jgi:2-dehydro-3-deoxyphosphogluconate aldolase/(4S)-4-hydroxy-2-oxoglutarate aldolase|nr:bifunctional 4-hydroxy-2-oxoglutarate aldolase/2-dehydro-3-deoxy-phosphogluconate aldolase [Tepidanaerobacteraceae bacterium]HOM43089.1 bifunctional 4-hydroxy-2-oxoglutarate aldolase/2-dehydro-3-deoxy-phosphogluconate aldolase [Bacillota bacterium]